MNFEPLKNCKYAVLGNPVAHSKSPQMQNAGFEFYGMGSIYGKIHVEREELAEFVEYARKNLSGFNITVPYKQDIIPFVDRISDVAKLSHSVNTVKIENGRFYATSTDGIGLATALQVHFNKEVKDLKVTFAGAGGAAQAAAWYFACNGAGSIFIANRSLAKAEQLSAELKKAFPVLECVVCELSDREKMSDFIKKSDVLIQSTSVGLKDDDGAPFELDILDGMSDLCVYDLIYKETKLLKYCRQHGIKHANGSDMLLYQGAASFEFWTNRKAPVDAMRQGLENA